MEQTTSAERTRGVLLALLAIPLGMILWVIIWRMGYIASIASLAAAAAAVWLYRVGSRGKTPDRKAAALIVIIIVAAVVLSFIAGVVSDGVTYLVDTAGLGFGEALSVALQTTFMTPLIRESYMSDLGLAALFGAIGAGWAVVSLFRNPQPTDTDESNSQPTSAG